jgi:hypothetical protein
MNPTLPQSQKHIKERKETALLVLINPSRKALQPSTQIYRMWRIWIPLTKMTSILLLLTHYSNSLLALLSKPPGKQSKPSHTHKTLPA